MIFPIVTPAQNSQEPATPASECPGLARACTGAARELIAARNLIAGYEQHIAAADERIRIAERQIETWKEKGALSALQVSELETVIAAEREAKAVMVKLKAEQEKRIVNLEKRLGRARKFGLITGVAAAVGILIAIGK